MFKKIFGKFGWIARIGKEALTANGTGILAGPHTLPITSNHHRAQADFLFLHTESLQRLRFEPKRENENISVVHSPVCDSVLD